MVQARPGLAVCSASSAGNMAVIEPPPWAREMICADADPVGMIAASDGARRMKEMGLKSVVAVPLRIMTDFNDVLQGAA